MTQITVEIEKPDSQAETVRREMGVAPSILISVEDDSIGPDGEVGEIKVTSFGLVANTRAAADLFREIADGIEGELGEPNG